MPKWELTTKPNSPYVYVEKDGQVDSLHWRGATAYMRATWLNLRDRVLGLLA